MGFTVLAFDWHLEPSFRSGLVQYGTADAMFLGKDRNPDSQTNPEGRSNSRQFKFSRNLITMKCVEKRDHGFSTAVSLLAWD